MTYRKAKNSCPVLYSVSLRKNGLYVYYWSQFDIDMRSYTEWLDGRSGIYIMQNTMIDGGMATGEENKKWRFRGENEMGERKTEENYIKNGETY